MKNYRNYFLLLVATSIVFPLAFLHCTRSASNNQQVKAPTVDILPMRIMEPISMGKPVSIVRSIPVDEKQKEII